MNRYIITLILYRLIYFSTKNVAMESAQKIRILLPLPLKSLKSNGFEAFFFVLRTFQKTLHNRAGGSIIYCLGIFERRREGLEKNVQALVGAGAGTGDGVRRVPAVFDTQAGHVHRRDLHLRPFKLQLSPLPVYLRRPLRQHRAHHRHAAGVFGLCQRQRRRGL